MGYVALNSNPLSKPVFNPIQNGRIVGMDFTRASTAWDYNSSLELGSFASNTPRFGFTPEYVSQGKGVLINEGVTHLAPRSAEVRSGAVWSVGRVSTNDTALPSIVEGYTISKITETADNNTHLILIDAAYRSVMTSGTTYTIAAVIEKGILANAPDWIQLRFAGTTHTTNYANFNLMTGAKGNVSNGTSEIFDLGEGKYLCVFHSTATTTDSGTPLIAFTNNTDATGIVTYAGNILADINVHYLDWYEGNFVQPYSLTLNSTVVVAADIMSTTNVDHFNTELGFSIWLETEFIENHDLTTDLARYFEYSDGSTDDRFMCYQDTNGDIAVTSRVGGVDQGSVAVTPVVGKNKVLISIGSFGLRLAVNGNFDSDADSDLPDVDRLYIGQSFAGSNFLNARIFEDGYKVINRVFTQTEMEVLTS